MYFVSCVSVVRMVSVWCTCCCPLCDFTVTISRAIDVKCKLAVYPVYDRLIR